MKKLLLLILVVCTTIFGANAQCTPDGSFTEPGVYPDSATNFLPAYQGQAYNQLITIKVPSDTVALIIGTVLFDKFVLNERYVLFNYLILIRHFDLDFDGMIIAQLCQKEN